MLDQDQNSPHPPDHRPSPVLSRHRLHKQKSNAPKKQPQRGLGVAQLEKLRLEEQSKQGGISLHGHGNLQGLMHQHHPQQQRQLFHHLHHHHHLHHQLSPQPSFRHMKLVEHPSESALAGLSEQSPRVCRVNGQSSFAPLAPGVAAMARQTVPLPLPLLLPQQQLQHGHQLVTNGSETQVHDLLCQEASHASNHRFPASTTTLTLGAPRIAPSESESPWQNQHSMHSCNLSMRKENHDLANRDLLCQGASLGCLLPSSIERKDKDQGRPGFLHAITSVGSRESTAELSPHASAQFLHNEGTPVLTDLCLRYRHVGAVNGVVDPFEQHGTSIAPDADTGLLMKELSSFQTISLCSTWPLSDQVSNRKRPWASTLEASCHTENFKGLDLNASVDEIQSEPTEQDKTSVSVPSTTRYSWSLSPLLSPRLMRTQSSSKLLPSHSACSECGSRMSENCSMPCTMKADASDSPVNGAGFLSLRKNSLDYDVREVETLHEFLKLGPSISSNHRQVENSNTISDSLAGKQNEKASRWAAQQTVAEKSKNQFSPVTIKPNTGNLREEPQPNYPCTPLSTKVELLQKLSWNKTSTRFYYPEQTRADGPLDLELRLSI